MARWTCPKCKREFGRTRQGHGCAPGMSLAEYFAQAQPWEEPIFNAVHQHLQTLEGGDLIVDPINVGILLKNGPAICHLRSMKKWVAVGFSLDHRLTSSRLSRKVVDYQGKFFHVINVNDAEEIDGEVTSWLTDAYYLPMGGPPVGADPMVPDDVDFDF